MKRALLILVATLLLAAESGCLRNQVRCAGAPGGCGCGHCGGLVGSLGGGRVAAALHENRGWRQQQPELGPPGPPVGSYAYPYYTLRGPREFLASNPPSIGN